MEDFVGIMGKLSKENLNFLLSYIDKDSRVIIPPLSGFDSGVHLINSHYLVISTDPCIDVPEAWFGWLLIHYAASDVALFGAKPEFCTINLLGPLQTRPEKFHKIMKQANKTARDLKIAIVTGHTGTYKGILSMIGICTVYGLVEKGQLITPGNAQPGDLILCTKEIGLEIAINLSLMRNSMAKSLFGFERRKELVKCIPMQSCVKEALSLAKICGINAMHDATEGGLISAINEMADTSQTGFRIIFEKIPICEEAYRLKEFFNLSEEQLFSMSSTGVILGAVNPQAKEKVLDVLSYNNIKANYIGTFTRNKKRILLKKGKEIQFPIKAKDPYQQIFSSN
jgi:hydrogenase maturation factor